VSTDAANKTYVDNLVNGLSWHPEVDAATTATITISTGLVAGQVIDGYTLVATNRVLVKNQSTGSQNGVYVVPPSGAPSLANDSVTGELLTQATFRVANGSVNGGTQWTLSTTGGITVGTTSLTFANTTSNTYTNGAGLSLTAGTFAVVPGNGILADGSSTRVDPSVVVRKFATTIGDGTTTSYTVTHSLGTVDVQAIAYLVSTGEVYEPDIFNTNSSTCTVVFAVAPATNTVRIVVQG
jgi:hypothetical protein